MNKHFQLTDIEFEQSFQRGNFDPELFTHEAHIRLAWIQISKYGLEVAIGNVCSQLKAFVAQLGAEDKFDKTLTIGAIKLVHHFMQKAESDNFRGFIAEFPLLNTDFKELMSVAN